jgi:hypothetical protein
MLTYNLSELDRLAVHFVGNPSQEEPLTLSNNQLDIQTDDHELVIRYMMHSFKTEAMFHFNPSANAVYDACKKIFSGENDFVEASKEIATHLYDVTTHPKILSGDLFVARINKVNFHGEFCDAIVILKAEQEDSFAQVEWDNDVSKLTLTQAYRLDRVDKACLVLSLNSIEGYKVMVVDKTNGNAAEAQYWIDAFLELEAIEDSFHFTKQYMNLTKDFVKEHLPEDFDVNPADQIALLNRSSKYFKEKDTFELDAFAEEVLQQPEVANAFKKFTRDYSEEGEHSITEQFDINQGAVKKHAGMFRSVLKLDKNFHIYVHGNRQLIERGYDDEKGMNFYKVFFSNESTT